MTTGPLSQLDIRAITFDVDGTLYDLKRQKLRLAPYLLRHPLILSRYNQVVDSMRHEKHRDMRGAICARLGEEVGSTPLRVKQVVDGVIHGSWPAGFSKRTPWPEMAKVLAKLDAAGLPRAVISDYSSDLKLERMGLDRGWAAVVDCERLGAMKPHPDGLLAAAEQMGIAPEHVLHIGDRPELDEKMAHAAGAHCLILGRDMRRMCQLPEMLLK